MSEYDELLNRVTALEDALARSTGAMEVAINLSAEMARGAKNFEIKHQQIQSILSLATELNLQLLPLMSKRV